MKREENKKRVYFISGGGTGGHIYPAVTVADELLKNENVEIFYVGNPKNLEFDIVGSGNDMKFLPVNVSGMPRKFSFKFLKWIFDLEIAIWKCLFYLLKYKPDAVFTTGGYVSAPVAFAAMMLKIPFMIHDCDAHPGLVSKQVAPFAKRVSVAFESSFDLLNSKEIVLCGNPVRKDFGNVSKQEARKRLNLNDKPTILAMGGSQGAMTINNSMIELAQEFVEELDVQVIIQTGKKNYHAVIKRLEEYFPNYYQNTNLIVKPYFDDMSLPMQAAEVVVARAGSLSLSEISCCALPSILVPYPYAAADHQRKNALEMYKKGAALYLEDGECDSKTLCEKLKSLVYNSEKLSQMSRAAAALAKPNATECIVKELKNLVK